MSGKQQQAKDPYPYEVLICRFQTACNRLKESKEKWKKHFERKSFVAIRKELKHIEDYIKKMRCAEDNARFYRNHLQFLIRHKIHDCTSMSHHFATIEKYISEQEKYPELVAKSFENCQNLLKNEFERLASKQCCELLPFKLVLDAKAGIVLERESDCIALMKQDGTFVKYLTEYSDFFIEWKARHFPRFAPEDSVLYSDICTLIDSLENMILVGGSRYTLISHFVALRADEPTHAKMASAYQSWLDFWKQDADREAAFWLAQMNRMYQLYVPTDIKSRLIGSSTTTKQLEHSDSTATITDQTEELPGEASGFTSSQIVVPSSETKSRKRSKCSRDTKLKREKHKKKKKSHN